MGFHGFSWVLWVLFIQTLDRVTTWTGGHLPIPKSLSLGPNLGFGDLKSRENPIFSLILWVFKWVFMGFDGFYVYTLWLK